MRNTRAHILATYCLLFKTSKGFLFFSFCHEIINPDTMSHQIITEGLAVILSLFGISPRLESNEFSPFFHFIKSGLPIDSFDCHINGEFKTDDFVFPGSCRIVFGSRSALKSKLFRRAHTEYRFAKLFSKVC